MKSATPATISMSVIFFLFVASAPLANASDQITEPSQAIKAFVDICLKTAPSFSEAAAAAKSYGIEEITDLGFATMGATKDQSMAVQISKNKECAITTESKSSGALTQQFIQAVSENTSTDAATKVPFRAKVKDDTFIFQHDRKGGEAFVMLKQNG